mmetsp:Transcript_9973/g.18732  ORF Transcript_9973/g.18732 Transcript_9973/m.18732 type:complete len:296 (+) Transcript_9973:280-1167(+)
MHSKHALHVWLITAIVCRPYSRSKGGFVPTLRCSVVDTSTIHRDRAHAQLARVLQVARGQGESALVVRVVFANRQQYWHNVVLKHGADQALHHQRVVVRAKKVGLDLAVRRVVLVGHEHRIPVRGQAVHVLLQIPCERRVVLPHEAARVLGAERAAQAAQHLARVQVPCRNDHRGIAQLAVRHPPRCAILLRVRRQGALAHQRVQRGAVAEVTAQPLPLGNAAQRAAHNGQGDADGGALGLVLAYTTLRLFDMLEVWHVHFDVTRHCQGPSGGFYEYGEAGVHRPSNVHPAFVPI